MVKPEKLRHPHLVYHFTVPLMHQRFFSFQLNELNSHRETSFYFFRSFGIKSMYLYKTKQKLTYQFINIRYFFDIHHSVDFY